MKWVVGCVAVLVAFVIGVAAGWVARAREPIAQRATAATSPPLPTPLPTPPRPPPPPPIATAPHVPIPWVEDDEKFAWPTSPLADVVAVDSTHYRVRRAFIDHFLADQSRILRDVRIVPDYEDGGEVGIKLFGVKATSDVARLGIQNGDMLAAINGVPVAQPENALDAYTHMRSAKRLVFDMERRGAPLKLHYRIED